MVVYNFFSNVFFLFVDFFVVAVFGVVFVDFVVAVVFALDGVIVVVIFFVVIERRSSNDVISNDCLWLILRNVVTEHILILVHNILIY